MKRRMICLLLAWGMLFSLCGCADQTGPVVFSLELPLSGEYQEQGDQFLTGAEAAVRWINERGGINGRSLALDVHDSAGLSVQSEACAAAAAERGDVLCLIGGVSTDCSMADAAVCQEAALPFFSLTANTDALSRFGTCVFSVYPSRMDHTRYLCQQLAACQCVAVLYSNDFDGGEAYSCFSSAAAELGLDVLAEPINVSDYNLGLIAEKLRQTNVDSVVIFTNAKASAELVVLMHQEGWQIPVYFASYETARSVTSVVGPLCEGIYTTDYGTGSDCSCAEEVSEGERLLFSGCADGFDTIWYLAECARRVSGRLNRDSFIESVYDQNDFCGLTGSFSFSESGTAIRNYCLLKYEDGSWGIVSDPE